MDYRKIEYLSAGMVRHIRQLRWRLVIKLNKVFEKATGVKPFSVNRLADASILPDIEKNVFESHSADIFNRIENDAYDCFRKYEQKSIEDIRGGRFEDLESNIGRALHFLQDMNNPMHVKSPSNTAKVDLRAHKQFEDSAMFMQKDVLQGLKDTYKPLNDFEFSLRAGLESTSKNSHSDLKDDRFKIEGLKNSYIATYEFLLKLAKIITN